MSTTDHRYPHADALAIALELKSTLAPFTERIEIVGSLRRKKATVGDVELLFIPAIESRQTPGELFSSPMNVDVAGEAINRLVADGRLEKRLSVAGHESWGAKNKLATHVQSGIPIDLFATTDENWHMSMVIRTGGLTTNLKLTNGAIERGLRLNAYGCGFTRSDGSIWPARSEREVFVIAGVPWQEPEERE